MNKKISVLILICGLVLVAVGIVLMAANGTPYLTCKQWLNEGSRGQFYTYALEEFPSVQAGYFGGIAMTVFGAIGFIVGAVGLVLVKKKWTHVKT